MGRSWPWALAAIAARLLIVSSVAVWQSKEKQSTQGQSPIADVASIENGEVAAVTQLGPEAKWSVARRDDAAPKQLRVNDVVSISEGEMQVRFESGVVVTLYAPAELEVISPMMGRAIRGRLSANVVDGAEGFAIETPRATVIDQGTVFGVEVGDEGCHRRRCLQRSRGFASRCDGRSQAGSCALNA